MHFHQVLQMGKSKYVLIPAYSKHPDNFEKLKKITLDFAFQNHGLQHLLPLGRYPNAEQNRRYPSSLTSRYFRLAARRSQFQSGARCTAVGVT